MSSKSSKTSQPRLAQSPEVDRIKPGRIDVEGLVSRTRKPFLPGATSEAYFGSGTPVLGVRIKGISDRSVIAYRARRLIEVAQSRSVAIVVLTNTQISPWVRAELQCEFVPYGAAQETEMEQDIIDLWGIDLILDYDDALQID